VDADDEHLLRYRTQPVTVDLWVDNILLYLDSDPYDDAFYELDSMVLSASGSAVPALLSGCGDLAWM
jgi:hypothetical protein